MYSFPRAAVTNDHKLGALKQQKRILSQSGGQESQTKVWTESALSGSSE